MQKPHLHGWGFFLPPIGLNTSTRSVVIPPLSTYAHFLSFMLMSVVGLQWPSLAIARWTFLPAVFRPNRHESANLAGSLTSVTFNLNFSGVGASYPSDMMVYIYAQRSCVVWGGWNVAPTGGCQNIGTGANNSWPFNWNTTANGTHVHPEHQRVRLGWLRSVVGDHPERMDRLVDGHIQLGCHLQRLVRRGVFDEACNFEPTATIANNDLCEYAIDYYPSGLYDCDGNCYLDFDGDLICNELEVPGCQEPWACNYNPQATDPPLPGFPCTYPQSDDVDCDGNSMLPQFLTQPQDLTVSCENI